jgi:hypothetical protein
MTENFRKLMGLNNTVNLKKNKMIRGFFKKLFLSNGLLISALVINLYGQVINNITKNLNHVQFNRATERMHIIPGMWRPLFENEQVAWISPPWESQEYVWFDFPEAIHIEGEFYYIGHLSKRFPTRFPTEKWVPWQKTENGIGYEQVLPNGIAFGGEIIQKEKNIAGLKIWITNGSGKELKDVMLLTCAYLNGIKEFDKPTNDNKFVHLPQKGWMSITKTNGTDSVKNGYYVGWLNEGEYPLADLPVVVVQSKTEEHLLALTWFEDTHAFIGNPNHPCVHADPVFHNLKPGESQTIYGELIFFEGSLDEFGKMFRQRLQKKGFHEK